MVSETGFAHPQLVAEGLEAAQSAVREQPAEVRNWESAASLLLASSRAQDAATAVDQADQATGGRATALLYLLRTRAMAILKRPDEAMASAVRAVTRAEPVTAAGIRFEATDILVSWAATMLPISSEADLNRYTDMVGLAAWCSRGVPEAEERVRPYRDRVRPYQI